MPAPQVVTFHFTLRDKLGQLLDSSAGGEPIAYLEGAGQIIEGLERALHDAQSGEKKTVIVKAAQGYGERDPQLVQKVSKKQLPVEEVAVGDRFQTGHDRHSPIVTVLEVKGDEVTLDANHPLAGTDLFFDIEIVERRAATQEEQEHGHAHGPGGHHHH